MIETGAVFISVAALASVTALASVAELGTTAGCISDIAALSTKSGRGVSVAAFKVAVAERTTGAALADGIDV